MAQTLTELVKQKQRDSAAWNLLLKVIENAKLTPEEEDQIYYCLGVSSPHEEARFGKTLDRLGNFMACSPCLPDHQ